MRHPVLAAPARIFPPGRIVRIAPLAKYSPDQPRVPAGHSDGGQWTNGSGSSVGSGGGGGSGNSEGRTSGPRLAQVIWICIAGSRSIGTDQWGNKNYWVTYECAGGRSFTRRGLGDKFPLIVLDPFR
jgi:hypothetical protein